MSLSDELKLSKQQLIKSSLTFFCSNLFEFSFSLSFSLVVEVFLSPGREFVANFDFKFLGCRDDFTNDVPVAGVLVSLDLDLCRVPRPCKVSSDASVDFL